MFSLRYEDALKLAARRHDGQRRKGDDTPYLTHLVHVGRILEPYGEDAVIAGLLHDILEDTCKTLEEVASVSSIIEERFGRPVLDAVRAVSEPKLREDGTKIRWKERKELYLAQLVEGPLLATKVSAADKIHNIATLVLQLDEQGDVVWERFRGSARESFWFYGAVAEVLTGRLGEPHALVLELTAQLKALKARLPEGASPARS